MTLRWSKGHGWAALALLAVVASALASLLLSAAFEKSIEPWARGFLVLVIVMALAAAWSSRRKESSQSRRGTLARRPAAIAFLCLALFSTFSLAVDVLSLFEPRPAIETEPGATQRAAESADRAARRIAATLDRPERALLVSSRIAGLWGRDDCSISFSIARKSEALIVKGVRQPPGTPPFHLIATIVREKGNVIDTRGESSGARGAAGSFTYETNGVVERLSWRDDSMGPDPTILDRC